MKSPRRSAPSARQPSRSTGPPRRTARHRAPHNFSRLNLEGSAAQPFFLGLTPAQARAKGAALRPADAPKTVVYPFGGGDLVSALVVFPDATETTTISLEAPGDVRAIDAIDKGKLAADLGTISHDIRRLYQAAHSTTKSLQAASHATLPGTLMFALAGLAVHDMEPLALRYFDLQPDASLRYLTNEELDQRAAEFEALKKAGKKGKPKPTSHFWYEQDTPYGNVEIQFRPRGDAKAAPRVYRHIVQNVEI